jgi:hypothetical protein
MRRSEYPPGPRALDGARAFVGYSIVLGIGCAFVAIGNAWERMGGLVFLGLWLWFGWRRFRRATLMRD